ncbi:hypothetical protein [Streptomyces ramulosus]|uniref:hypothetical protein n=1 Tax=Streptomyces ramulosus TaxID=47762 RepID=UPI003AA893DC
MTERQQERTAEGGVPTRIGQAVMLHRAGDREEARNRLAALWHELGPSADPLHRCTLAHYLAATQDTPRDRLSWDLTALEAAEGSVTTGRARGQRCAGEEGSGKGGSPIRYGHPRRDAHPHTDSHPNTDSYIDSHPNADDDPPADDAPPTGDDPLAGDGLNRDDATGDGDGPRPAVSTDRSLAALRALFPALHLSLVADYAALGRPGDARTHLLRARTWAAALPDGAHRQTLYADIDRLGAGLGGGPGRG